MQDCPRKDAYPPVMTPPFHQATRVCRGCRHQGCVVPRCLKWSFEPRQPDRAWHETPANRGAEAMWRCRRCDAANSTYA